MAVVAILDGFFEFGFDLALIRNKDAGRDDFDTVWTMRLLKGTLFGLLVIAVSPAVAHYAQDDAVVMISVAIGLGLVIRGFENIGVVRFEKELQFDRLFAVRLYPRLAGAATTIGLAFALRSYWAIVLGAMMQNVYMALFSYWLCDYRPRPCCRARGPSGASRNGCCCRASAASSSVRWTVSCWPAGSTSASSATSPSAAVWRR